MSRKSKASPKSTPNSAKAPVKGSFPWPIPVDEGKDLSPEIFSKGMLIVPKMKDSTDEEEFEATTFSLSASQRYTTSKSPELRVPKKSATKVLQNVGLKNYERVEPESKNILGGYSSLETLGITAAFFEKETDIARAKNDLLDEYYFVPNFSFHLPNKFKLDSSPANRGRSNLPNSQWPEISGVKQAHNSGIKGANVLFGILDTGVDADHVEFSNKTINYRYVPLIPNSPHWPPRDVRGFDTDNHGTHVTGIVAGNTTGVSPEVDLYVASVIESESTAGALTRVASGLDWLLKMFSTPGNQSKPAVVNMSLGFPSKKPVDISNREWDERLEVVRIFLRALIQNNAIPFCAIGNDGEDNFRWPGGFNEVIGVGAVDFDENIAHFSGNDPDNGKPDLVGYGVGVYSGIERDYAGNSIYERFNGTSMACPYVAGIAALYRCLSPTKSVKDIRDELFSTAKRMNANKKRAGFGLARFM